MPIKTPPRNTVTVDIHTRPVQPDSLQVRQPELPHCLDPGMSNIARPHNPRDSASTSGRPDLDAISPVVVTPTPVSAASGTTATPVIRTLEDYRISVATHLPNADAEGFIMFKGRRYVEVAEVGIIAVATDASGQHRARLPSELEPSGPLLVRDSISRLWHQVDESPITFALSESSLQGFRTPLDFADVEPDVNGLHRFDGKLYVVIDSHTYQALHDLDASTPLTPVMRIVRAADAVAGDVDNRYVATRPGRSQPIVFDAVEGWVGVSIPGAGGMRRAGDPPPRTLKERLSAALNRLKSPESRVRKLYPALTERQVTALLTSLGDDVSGGLARREAEYKNMEKALKAWSLASSQDLIIRLNSIKIKQCWQSPTTKKLELRGENFTLPLLKADFSHVRTLELDQVNWSVATETFLSNFTGLTRLTVARSTLKKLPDSLATLHNLTELNLRNNQLRLDEQAAVSLGKLTKLKSIDLSENPLGRTPDFSAMSDLQTLNLSKTGLKRWPEGLQHQSRLKLVDLRGNDLREVPNAVLNPPAEQLSARARINGVTQLEDNRFEADLWRSLDAFWVRVAADHPELAAQALPGAFRLDGHIPEIAMVRRMYPDKDVQTAKAYWNAMDDATQKALPDRMQKFDLMAAQLERYVQSSSTANVQTRQWVQQVARSLKECWLNDSLTTLKLPKGRGPLPALEADFSHVRSLEMNNIAWSDAGDRFLSSFTHLKKLSITQSDLGRLPASVEHMQQLTHLDLSNNRIALDEHTTNVITGLHQLSDLNLSGNPLDGIPDFTDMSGLEYLRLRNTEIEHWPSGLQNKTALKVVDLRDNRLNEVPHALLEPASDQLLAIGKINSVIQLDGNDFPTEYWRKFDDFWQRLNEAHPELTPAAEGVIFDSGDSPAQRYQRLYPGKDINQCRKYLWSLEGDTAVTTLRNLEQEFGKLKQQLDDWVFSGRGARSAYARANQVALNAQARPDREIAAARILSCWRRETPQKLAFDRTPIGLELDLSGLWLGSLPDLDIDFSHVGSLKLSHMNLSISPEGFLTRFRHVRWLDLSHNQLHTLPPAIGEMNGLTRLFLQNNQLMLTADTARVISERRTLRGLALHNNPQLGVAPDFNQITDMRSLNLAHTGIDTFPSGIADQPLLDHFDLSSNRIVDIPDAVIAPTNERFLNTARVNDFTNIGSNPLSEATLARIDLYEARLIEAQVPLREALNLVDTARVQAPVAMRALANNSMARWTTGMSPDQINTRKIQWQTVREEEGSNGFFNMLELLRVNKAGHADQQRRLWALIDSMTEHSVESKRLRRELLDRAGDATCCDRAAFTFTNLETKSLAFKAIAQATDQTQGRNLSMLSRGLFRLHEVDKIASADIARSEAILGDPATSEIEKLVHGERLREEVEIRLAYRYGLKDRLQLPAQPDQVFYTHMAKVSEGALEAAYRKVVALDDSPEEFQALLSEEFWQDYVTNKYRGQFEDQRQPFQLRQTELAAEHAANRLTLDEFKAQSESLEATNRIEEASLIETLSRQELGMVPVGNNGAGAAG